jgi:hypothetical protein
VGSDVCRAGQSRWMRAITGPICGMTFTERE